jgi:hypothetical protein
MLKIKRMVMYKARYRKREKNPFDPFNLSPGAVGASITALIGESVAIEKVEQMAKEATPGCYEFVNVKHIG